MSDWETGRGQIHRPLFASKHDVRDSRLALRDAGDDRWLHDRHHNALRTLG